MGKYTGTSLGNLVPQASGTHSGGELHGGNHYGKWRYNVQDSFTEVWESEVVPQLAEGLYLTSATLFADLQKRHPGKYMDSQLTVFKRKVEEWKLLQLILLRR